MLLLEFVGLLTLSGTLLKVKSAGMVILGNELNRAVLFESCFRGTERRNQEVGLSFAVVFATGAKLKSGSVLVAGTELNTKDDPDGSFVSIPDGRPKKNFDELVSLVSDKPESPATVGCVFSFCVAPSDTTGVGLSVFTDALRIDLGGKDIPEFLFSGCRVVDAVGTPESAFDEFLNLCNFL